MQHSPEGLKEIIAASKHSKEIVEAFKEIVQIRAPCNTHLGRLQMGHKISCPGLLCFPTYPRFSSSVTTGSTIQLGLKFHF
ncbi:hypothetical protein F0562_028136 [Nyssa sinensis]|uniref:Uncharacterized protein n=1 Tax=Nyssa sinensis TaxID=561372 RepID=A0A5J5B5J6_9ASTE|nr:hypothetical protein F0562_028136 [Nyssa sinensis]